MIVDFGDFGVIWDSISGIKGCKTYKNWLLRKFTLKVIDAYFIIIQINDNCNLYIMIDDISKFGFTFNHITYSIDMLKSYDIFIKNFS